MTQPRQTPHRRFWRPDRPGARLKSVRVGDRVVADDGFACIAPGEILTVRQDTSKNRSKFVACNHGRHYLCAEPDERVAGFQQIDRQTEGQP